MCWMHWSWFFSFVPKTTNFWVAPMYHRHNMIYISPMYQLNFLVQSPVVFSKTECRWGRPENYLFSLSQKKHQDESIQKTVYVILKTEALLITGFVSLQGKDAASGCRCDPRLPARPDGDQHTASEAAWLTGAGWRTWRWLSMATAPPRWPPP